LDELGLYLGENPIFAVDSHHFQILFASVVMNSDLLPPQFTIRFCAAIRCFCFFKAARILDDEGAHFFPEPIFLASQTF
jgi:hypothetical protein